MFQAALEPVLSGGDEVASPRHRANTLLFRTRGEPAPVAPSLNFSAVGQTLARHGISRLIQSQGNRYIFDNLVDTSPERPDPEPLNYVSVSNAPPVELVSSNLWSALLDVIVVYY